MRVTRMSTSSEPPGPLTSSRMMSPGATSEVNLALRFPSFGSWLAERVYVW